MGRISDLRFYYPNRNGTADGGNLPSFTADGANTTSSLQSSTLTGTANYWNGAAGFFNANTATTGLRGEYFHVKASSGTTLTLYRSVSAAAGTADTFRLVHGGKFRTDFEVPGLTFTAPVHATGVNIGHVGYENGTGAGTLSWAAAGSTVTWDPPIGSAGIAVTVAAAGTYVVSDDSGSCWIEVTSNAAGYAGTNTTDIITLTRPNGILVPDAEGTETTDGKTRYYALPFKNNGTDIIYDCYAYLSPEVSVGTNTLSGTVADGGAGAQNMLFASTPTGWPTSGWVYNSVKNDCRYFYNRSGTASRVSDPGAGQRGKTSVAWGSADALALWPDIDIGAGAMGTDNSFETPASETSGPSGVTFSTPLTAAAGISYANLAAAEVNVVWIRNVIPAGMRGKSNALSQIKFQCDVTG